MNPAKARDDNAAYSDHRNFSIVAGGPLFQILRAIHLADDSSPMTYGRILTFVLVTWLPLLVLSVFEGHARAGSVAMPFLRDVEVHIKFLVVMPLLLRAETAVHSRLSPIANEFVARRLIPKNSIGKFDAAIASAMRLRDSALAEILIIAFVYVVGVLVVWRQYVALDTATWYATPSGNGSTLSLAGLWYSYISIPFFQFLLIRWYFRLCIWARFLWQVSRIELALVPTHPDRAAGLGYLSDSVYALAPLAAAHGALLSALLANRIFYAKASLPDFKFGIAFVLVYTLCLTVGPLLVFSSQLLKSWLVGDLEYGRLAERYVRSFDAKWLRGGAKPDDVLIGSADIQSLADMSNSFEVVRSMQVVPVTMGALIAIVVATLAPIAPLLLTMMSLDTLAKDIFDLIF